MLGLVGLFTILTEILKYYRLYEIKGSFFPSTGCLLPEYIWICKSLFATFLIKGTFKELILNNISTQGKESNILTVYSFNYLQVISLFTLCLTAVCCI